MSKRYWEATGAVKEQLRQMLAQREACRAEMFAFAKRHGADRIGVSESLTTGFLVAFDAPPDPKLWKKTRHGYYAPKQTSKVGKAMAKEMEAIAHKSPSGIEANKIIGANCLIRDGMWHTAGCALAGDRVLVVTHDEYAPPPDLAGDLTRISDVEYEEAMAMEGTVQP